MYPAPTNLVSFVDAVSSCGSLVLCTRGVLFQTPKKVGAIVSSAPAENNKGTGLMRLDARATYLCHCKTLMTDNLEGGIEKGQMISFGKYMLLRLSREDEFQCTQTISYISVLTHVSVFYQHS